MAIKKEIEIEVNDNLDKTDKRVKELNNSLKDNSEAVKDTTQASQELGKTTDNMTGGMIGKFKSLISYVKNVVTSMGLLKTAIIGTGLGALFIAIMSIKQAFTSSEEGQNRYTKIMAVLGSIVGNITDILSEFGEMLIWVFTNPVEAIKSFAKSIKENIVNRFVGILELIPNLGKAIGKLFSGDFKGAAKTAADAVGKVTLGMESVTDSIVKATNATKAFIKEQQRELKIAQEIANSRAKADKLERSLIVQRAEADRQIADLRDKAVQKDLYGVEQRIKFLKEASTIEEAITAKEIKAAVLRRDAIIEENKLSRSNKEALQAEEEAKAKVIELETKSLQAQKALNKALYSARQEARADAKLISDEKKRAIDEKAKLEQEENEKSLKSLQEKAQKELEIERARLINLKNLENEYLTQLEQAENEYQNSKLTAQQLEVQNVNDKYFELLTKAQQFNQDTTILEQAQKDALTQINDKYRDEEAKKDEALRNQKLDAVKNTFQTLSNLTELFAGKSKKAQERAFKVQKAINIASAILDTYKAANTALASAPPPYSFFAAGAAITAGMLNVKKIASTKFESGGSSGGGGGSTAPSGVGGGSFGSAGGGGVISPNFNIVGNNGQNQTNQLQPVQAYVVSGEMTTQQALDRNRLRNATF